MKIKPNQMHAAMLSVLLVTISVQNSSAHTFEGRICATLTRAGDVETFFYTVGLNCLRVERGETNRPYAVNLVHRDSGAVTLLYPNNRSFVSLKPATENVSVPTPGVPLRASSSVAATPGSPSPSQGVGPSNLPGMSALPAIPQMPPVAAAGGMVSAIFMMPTEKAELMATTDTTNLLGFACTRYELKQPGEVMEIWATTQLLPFPSYQQNQSPRFGPRMIDEEWGRLVREKGLFPLLVVLRFEPQAGPGLSAAGAGSERMRFEVKSVVPGKLTDNEARRLAPPGDYQEIQPLPF